MNARCVNEECAQKIEADWPFCPHCGEDNRPPADRQEVGKHRHTYIGRVGFCVECGAAADGLPSQRRKRWVLYLLTAALLLFLIGQNVRMAGEGRPALFGSWIKSWYSRSVTHEPAWYDNWRVRMRGTTTSTLGLDTVYRFNVFAIVAAVGAAGLAVGKLIPKTRPTWNPNGDL